MLRKAIFAAVIDRANGGLNWSAPLLLTVLVSLCVAGFAARNAGMVSSTCADTVSAYLNDGSVYADDIAAEVAQQTRNHCRIPALDGFRLVESENAAWISELSSNTVNIFGFTTSVRNAYLLSELTLDLLFPISYALWLCALIALVHHKSSTQANILILFFLPIGAAIFDLFENLLIVLYTYLELTSFELVYTMSSIKWALLCLSVFAIFWPMRYHIVAARIPILMFALLLFLAFSGGPDSSIANALKVDGAVELIVSAFATVSVSGLILFCFLHVWNLGSLQLGIGRQREARYRISWLGDGSEQVKAGTVGMRRLALRILFTLLPASFLLNRIYLLSSYEYGNVSLLWFLLGIVLGVLVIALFEAFRATLGEKFKSTGLGSKIAALSISWNLGPGFATEDTDLRRGHFLALLYLLLLSILYVFGLLTGLAGVWWPVVVYVLLLLGFVTYFTTLLTFVFDKHRLPVLLVLLVWVSLASSISSVSHIFEVHPVEDSRSTVAEYVEHWNAAPRFDSFEAPSDAIAPKPVMTVIAAKGGGIQASAWATKALAELWEIEGFGDSLGFIGATSGGATGAWLFLEALNRCTRTETCQSLDWLHRPYRAAIQSSLAATAWGMAYPDFTRVVAPILNLRAEKYDRAWAMEQSWWRNCRQADICIEPIPEGAMMSALVEDFAPAFAFNSATVEQGFPLVLSNIRVSELEPFAQPSAQFANYEQSGIETDPLTTTVDGKQYWFQTSRVTAARLSATFPYVTPNAKPRIVGTAPEGVSIDTDWHAIDGGVLDNDAVFIAANFIERVAAEHADLRFVLITIDAFPDAIDICPHSLYELEQSTLSEGDLPCIPSFEVSRRSSDWLVSILGPFQALLNIRSTGQSLRGDERLQALGELLPSRLEIISVSPLQTFTEPPLSWQLSARNVDYIDRSWQLRAEREIESAIQCAIDPCN